jgi:ATP-dependent DNA helicase RecQ
VLGAVAAGNNTITTIARATSLPRRRLVHVVEDFVAVGLLERRGRRLCRSDDDADIGRVVRLQERRRQVVATQLLMLERYLDARRCRWHGLLAYFGEPSDERCGHCDVCDVCDAPGPTDRATQTAEGAYREGSLVVHPVFGPGNVVDLDRDRVTILFDDGSYRVFDAALLAELGVR